jgi:hypothetical protein
MRGAVSKIGIGIDKYKHRVSFRLGLEVQTEHCQ